MPDQLNLNSLAPGLPDHIANGFPGQPSGRAPVGFDFESAEAVERYLRSHEFPIAKDGHFAFAFIDDSGIAAKVYLRHGLAGHRQAPEFFRCAAGRAFLLNFDAPAVNRLEYQFAVMQSDGTEKVITDPMNTRSVADPFGEKSVVFADDYREPWYVAPVVPEIRGTLQEIALPGFKRGRSKGWIWHPPDARSDETLPLVLFLDGGDYLQFASAATVLANLVSRDAISRCRAIFVSPANRNDEYSCNRAMARHLTTRIPEAIARIIPVPSDPAHRIAVGASLGGVCLLHAHLTASAPNESFFGGLLMQSGSYFQPATDSVEVHFRYFDRISEFISRVLNESFSVPRIPFYMTCGRGEENLINNRVMAAALQSKEFPLKFIDHPDAHNWTSWRDCLGDGLTALLDKKQSGVSEQGH